MRLSRCAAACSGRRALKMATFSKRKGMWHVRIRRQGYPTQCGVFDTKREAEDWAGGVESQMVKRLHLVDKRSHVLTLGKVIDQYIAIVIDAYADKPPAERRLKGHQPQIGRAHV